MFGRHHPIDEILLPIGKEMAEALLESDESTASLSDNSVDREALDEVKLCVSQRTKTEFLTRPWKMTSSLERNVGSPALVLPPPGFQGRSPTSAVASMKGAPLLVNRYVALDCEMVGVGPDGKRSILARVSLVDFYGRCLLDNFVRVEERVTDYRTQVTGLSEGDLSSRKAVPFAVCRKRVIQLIRHKVLVGHGLAKNLAALGVMHPWYNIRDTATYLPFQRLNRFGKPCPRRLRELAQNQLGLNIQSGGHPHCTIEGACTAMALYRNQQATWDQEIDCRNRGFFGENSRVNHCSYFQEPNVADFSRR